MGILGDISRRQPSDPRKSDAQASDKEPDIRDVPLRTEGGGRTESEKVSTTVVSEASQSRDPGRPLTAKELEGQSPPVGPATAGPAKHAEPLLEQQSSQPHKCELAGGALDELPLRSTTEPPRSDEQVVQEGYPNDVVARAANYLSRPEKDANEGQERRAIGAAEEGNGPQKTSMALWALVLVLVLALAGLAGYRYLTVRQNGVGQLPEVEQLVGTLHSRLNATEAKLQGLTANWAALSQQVAALNGKMRSGLESSRRHAEELIMHEQERIEAEMAKRDQAINARLARVESQQQVEKVHLAEVQDWMQKNVQTVREEIAGEREDRGRDTSALRQDVGQGRSNLQDLAQKVERQRVDFELTKNREQELVPGISLTVTRTDARYQRFEGYLELLEDSRTLWLSKVSAQQAVPFYLKQNGQPYDLVVETVKRNGVVGYLLVPRGTGKERASETAPGTPATSEAQPPSGNSF